MADELRTTACGLIIPGTDVMNSPDANYRDLTSGYTWSFDPTFFGLASVGSAGLLAISGNSGANVATERMSHACLFDGGTMDLIIRANASGGFSFDKQDIDVLAIAGCNVATIQILVNINPITNGLSPTQFGGGDSSWVDWGGYSIYQPPQTIPGMDKDTYNFLDNAQLIPLAPESFPEQEFYWVWVRVTATEGSLSQLTGNGIWGKCTLAKLVRFEANTDTLNYLGGGAVNLMPEDPTQYSQNTSFRNTTSRTAYGNTWTYRMNPLVQRRLQFTSETRSHGSTIQQLILGSICADGIPFFFIRDIGAVYPQPFQTAPSVAAAYTRFSGDYEQNYQFIPEQEIDAAMSQSEWKLVDEPWGLYTFPEES